MPSRALTPRIAPGNPYALVTAGPNFRSHKLQTLELIHEIDRRKMLRSLHEFTRQAWHVIEPGRPFVDNWHIEAMCGHLQAVSERKIKRLLINVPFRTSKSTIVSVMWPAWVWAQDQKDMPYAGPTGSITYRRNNMDGCQCA